MRKPGDTAGFGGQRRRCTPCRRRFTTRSTSAFSRRAFPDDIVAAAVVEWLAERGITVDRSTVYRWARRYLPLFAEAARSHRRPVGASRRVDETYLRLSGRWVYAYRAIAEAGQVVDVSVSERRNTAAARAFFARAIDETAVRPHRITTDEAGCYPSALRAVLPEAEHRAAKYLNNGLERDHGHRKQRIRPMRGFKSLASADHFSRGHGLIQNLRNGFSTLPAALPRPLRLLSAWPQLAQMI